MLSSAMRRVRRKLVSSSIIRMFMAEFYSAEPYARARLRTRNAHPCILHGISSNLQGGGAPEAIRIRRNDGSSRHLGLSINLGTAIATNQVSWLSRWFYEPPLNMELK